MNKEVLESIKGLSREERKQYFESHKAELLDDSLKAVNGGTGEDDDSNPTSEIPFGGNWFSSPGFVCEGEVQC